MNSHRSPAQAPATHANAMNPESRPDISPAIEKLNSWKRFRLVLLVAPPGTGKTALLRKWAQEWKPGCGESPAPRLAWIDLDPRDNDPHHFLASLHAALNMPSPPLPETTLHFEGAMAGLTNELASLPTDLILVLDHYHHIHTPAVHAAVARFLDYPPPGTHLVIASREEPPLLLPRLRARRQMVEIRPEELRAR